jgi:hemerythrin-like domain-containing protein
MLRSMTPMVDRGPGDNPQKFFDVLRTMLFYIDEFPERLHHPKESELLFPRVVQAASSVTEAVERLEETVILPEAEKMLTEDDWKALDAAFEKNCDPLTGKYPPNPRYARQFTRIVMRAPAPIGLRDA